MKKHSLKIITASLILLSVSCLVSLGGVSAAALSIGDLFSSGLGADISSVIESVFSDVSSTEAASVYPGRENDLDSFFGKLNLKSDMLRLIDLSNYLKAGGSFESWLYDNYGSDMDIPPSVKEMPPDELILYIVGLMLYPDGGNTTITDKYVFEPSTSSETSETQSEALSETTSSRLPSYHETTDSAQNTSAYDTDYIPGDVNGDGEITASDARLALRAGAQLASLGEKEFLAADVNGDKRITAKDARSILRYSAKITDSF